MDRKLTPSQLKALRNLREGRCGVDQPEDVKRHWDAFVRAGVIAWRFGKTIGEGRLWSLTDAGRVLLGRR